MYNVQDDLPNTFSRFLRLIIDKLNCWFLGSSSKGPGKILGFFYDTVFLGDTKFYFLNEVPFPGN